MLIFWIGVFIASLALLLFSADRFTNNAERIGVMMKLPSFVVGVIIVSIGTSLPELLTAISAMVQGVDNIVVSNAFGSNIANIFLVFGVASLFAKKVFGVSRSLIDLDLPLLALATGLVALMAYDGQITFPESALLLIGYGIYLYYIIKFPKKKEVPLQKRVKAERVEKDNADRKKKALSAIFQIVLFGALLAVASNYLVESTIKIAEIIGVSTAVITASVIALGTSLPELIVSIFAVRKGSYDLVIGNVLGSNIFNALVVIGLPGLFGVLTVDPVIMTVGIPFLIASTLLVVVSGISKRIHGYEGAFYILLYLLFMGKLFELF